MVITEIKTTEPGLIDLATPNSKFSFPNTLLNNNKNTVLCKLGCHLHFLYLYVHLNIVKVASHFYEK
jgi:hypothetical protein